MSRISHGDPGTVYVEQERVTVETHVAERTGLFDLYLDREYADGEFQSVLVHLDTDDARALRQALNEFLGDDK
mgnify:CR=1 FL=1